MYGSTVYTVNSIVYIVYCTRCITSINKTLDLSYYRTDVSQHGDIIQKAYGYFRAKVPAKFALFQL